MGYRHYSEYFPLKIDTNEYFILKKLHTKLPIETKPEYMTDVFIPNDYRIFYNFAEIQLTIQSLSKYVIIPQYSDKLFNLFQKYEYCPSKHDRDFVRKHASVLNFSLNYYDKSFSFEDMFRSWPSLIMNSVNRCHIPYKSTFNFQIGKSGPLLAIKMLKYGFGNMKYIGIYDQWAREGFEKLLKFLISHRSTKFHGRDYYNYDDSDDVNNDDDSDDVDDDYLDQDIEVFSFHHCKKCKELTSRHKRSMFAFILHKEGDYDDSDKQIHCFVLF